MTFPHMGTAMDPRPRFLKAILHVASLLAEAMTLAREDLAGRGDRACRPSAPS